jgi:hypothetical protein
MPKTMINHFKTEESLCTRLLEFCDETLCCYANICISVQNFNCVEYLKKI